MIAQRISLLALAVCLAAAMVFGAPSRAAAEGALYAEQITPANAAQRRVGGIDAVGGTGDWAIGNGTLCGVVSDPSHDGVFTVGGGFLVDLAHCGRADDEWNVLQQLPNAKRVDVPGVESVEARLGADRAELIARAAGDGLVLETRYSLDRVDPERMLITTRVTRSGDGPQLFFVPDILLHANHSMAAFSLSSQHPAKADGFLHPHADSEDMLSMLQALRPFDMHVFVGSNAAEPGIAYGIRWLSAHLEKAGAERETLHPFSITGRHFTMLGVLSRAPWWGGSEPDGPSWLRILQVPFLDVAVGEALVIERELRVGQRADVASVTDALWRDAPRVHGQLDDAAARIAVDRADGTPLTWVRPDAEGRFAFRAPPGSYALRLLGAAGVERVEALEVAESDVDLGQLTSAPPAELVLPRDAVMRLVFKGVGATPDPEFRSARRGLRLGERRLVATTQSNDISLAGVESDPQSVRLPAGRYKVYATRGPEFTLGEARIELRAGARQVLEIATPWRAIDTPGWLSADLHVHSGVGNDSDLPLRMRVRSLVAQGLEVVVSTEHDRLADYAPIVHALGLDSVIQTVVGSELTSTARTAGLPHTAGHLNAWPLPIRPRAYREGLAAIEGRRPGEIIERLRADEPGVLVQLNHPRSGTSLPGNNDFLTHLGVRGTAFDPTLPLTAEANRSLLDRLGEAGTRDIDFDAIEIMNGKRPAKFIRSRADWLSLLFQGEIRTATANSDSHGLDEVVGWPRNYVRVANARHGERFDVRAFTEAVRAGHVVGTTGPMIDVRLGTVGPGERFSGSAGLLEVDVLAAPWVPAQTLRVYVDAELVAEAATGPGDHDEIPLEFARDSFVTVEVSGHASEAYAAVAPGFAPLAFTNPIFVDADGDGAWSGPGLPQEIPELLLPESLIEAAAELLTGDDD